MSDSIEKDIRVVCVTALGYKGKVQEDSSIRLSYVDER
jgi:hypothetical protein